MTADEDLTARAQIRDAALWLLGIGAALTAGGLAGFRRRDIALG